MKKQILIWLLMGILGPQAIWATTATIMRVEGKVVEIDIGALRGISVGMTADILSEAGRVVHPITGEDYGSRKVKIGEMTIEHVNAETALGRLTVMYAPVKVGDVAEGLIAIPSAQERMQMEIDEARSEIKSLARNLAEEIKANKKAIEDLRKTLQRVGSSEKRLQGVMNAVQNMREKLVLVESRVGTLEQQQQILIAKDTAEVDVLGKLNINDLGVLTRGAGEEIILRVGDRSYKLNFETNKLEETQQPPVVVPTMEQPATTLPMPQTEISPPVVEASPKIEERIDDLFAEDKPEEPAEWYYQWQILAPVFGFVGILLAGLILMMKRRKRGGGSSGGKNKKGRGNSGFEEVEEEETMVDDLDDLPELETAEEEK